MANVELKGKNTLHAVLDRMLKIDKNASITMSANGLVANIKGKQYTTNDTSKLADKVDTVIEFLAEQAPTNIPVKK